MHIFKCFVRIDFVQVLYRFCTGFAPDTYSNAENLNNTMCLGGYKLDVKDQTAFLGSKAIILTFVLSGN